MFSVPYHSMALALALPAQKSGKLPANRQRIELVATTRPMNLESTQRYDSAVIDYAEVSGATNIACVRGVFWGLGSFRRVRCPRVRVAV